MYLTRGHEFRVTSGQSRVPYQWTTVGQHHILTWTVHSRKETYHIHKWTVHLRKETYHILKWTVHLRKETQPIHGHSHYNFCSYYTFNKSFLLTQVSDFLFLFFFDDTLSKFDRFIYFIIQKYGLICSTYGCILSFYLQLRLYIYLKKNKKKKCLKLDG